MAALELASTPLFGDANLIAYYKLENTSDSKGSNTLTNNNTVTFTAAQFNNGANFGTANTNKNLTVASTLGLTSNQNRTIGFWVKMLTELSGADSFGAMCAITHADIDIQFRMGYRRISSVNSVWYDRGKNGIATTPVSSNTNLGTAAFHHMAMTWDGTNLTGYLDGSSIGSVTPGTGSGNNGNVDQFAIGSDFSSTSVNFQSCLIDDLAVFNRVLTATEISNLYNGTFAQGNFLAFM